MEAMQTLLLWELHLQWRTLVPSQHKHNMLQDSQSYLLANPATLHKRELELSAFKIPYVH